MLLRVERPVFDEVGEEQEEQGEHGVQSRREAPSDLDDGLLGTAVPIMIAAYGASLAIVTYTFWQSAYALLAIAVCVVYMGMFFGVPVAMARIRNGRDARWQSECRESKSDRISVFGGSIGRTEAVLQMTIVPLAVVLAFAAFAVIWLTVKP
jgi:hypothetical protein